MEAYPLSWPSQRPRTEFRKQAQFNKKKETNYGWQASVKLTVADALGRLQREIDLIGATNYILSTNLQTRLDGLPRSNQAEPSDPGAALYFDLNGKPHCLPCDTFDRVADNIAAIAKHINATRAIERYGVASIEAMFTGFTALPPPITNDWRKVLGISMEAGIDDAEAAYKKKARSAHPDAGGSQTAMAELNAAIDLARRHFGKVAHYENLYNHV